MAGQPDEHGERQGGTEPLQQWPVVITTLFAVAAIGFGGLLVVIDALDEEMFEIDDGGGFFEGLAETLVESVLTSVVFVLLVGISLAAVFVGAWLGRELTVSDREAFGVAAASLAAGSAVFFFISFSLVTLGFDGVSVRVGGLLVHTILTAVGAALMAVGGVWAVRHRFPT